jgi:hypothetical protein
MANPKQGVQGEIEGKPISHETATKIQDVLKSTLQKELQASKPTVGSVGGRHGSITHGSIIFEE